MTLQSKTIFKYLPYVLFILVHFLLLNANTAEWGDSYRILRASEFIRDGSYPEDEKRPPLYSIVLAVRPESVNSVMWARGFMFVAGLAGMFLFGKFLGQFIKDERFVFLGMLLLLFNPDFLYWSIRVMADVPFALLALLAIYLYKKWKDSWSFKRLFILGIVAGFSILTRFEGYILAGSLFLSLFIEHRKKLKIYVYYGLGVLVVVLPWLLYRSPFSSEYLEEPAGRAYDLKIIWIYIASLLAIYGFVPAFSFIRKDVWKFITNNLHVSIFLLLELLLILLWPAAIPRLFVAVVPLLILILTLSLEKWWENGKENKKIYLTAASLLLLYAGSQFFLKLQFLVLDKVLLGVLFVLQVAVVFFIVKKKFWLSVVSLAIIMSLWSGSVIKLHKDIFISVKNAAEYASKNLEGKIAYNDVSSISDFYLNVLDTPKVSGFYYNTESKKNLTYEALLSTGADYTMELDLESRPYLKPVKDFGYNVNGAEFFAKIVKFERKD
ncbi:MAG: hypothetical protein UU90_C0019G0011 [candidate division WWE3 bacterium GW2011_GWD2_42_11]|nr:MAG: hypothetical protein UU90_C0019G0011 [candidate division WWE3 bacterium GW2011_GWD2_42_11]